MSNQLPEKIHFGVIVEGHKAEMHECPFPKWDLKISSSKWRPTTSAPPTTSSGWACATIRASRWRAATSLRAPFTTRARTC